MLVDHIGNKHIATHIIQCSEIMFVFYSHVTFIALKGECNKTKQITRQQITNIFFLYATLLGFTDLPTEPNNSFTSIRCHIQ